MVKGWCTDSAQGITSDGVQVHGGMGYVEETGASQHMRDARITTIYEGTTGIQANDLIGRKLAREGGRTLKALLAASTAMRAGWSNRPMQCWRRSAARWQPLPRRWTKRPTGCWPTTVNPRSAAGAVPFLRLAGTVIGGWLSARMAEAATAQLAAGAGDAGFRYQARHSQPLRGACPGAGADAARHRHGGAASTLALADDQL